MKPEKFLSENNISPEKKLDQFFLGNESVLKEEIELAELKGDDIVLEIGAGFGGLTEKIAEKCRVIAVEKDEKFIPFLKKIQNITVVNDDINHFLKTSKEKFNKIISNIPYSKSQDIVLELLKHSWDIAILVVQKEFAEKMIGKEKLGMLLQDCAYVKTIQNIPADDFYPKAVESSIVKIKQKKIMDEKLWEFLKFVYKNRNKNTGNVIKNCPQELKNKKVHQLTLEEIKPLFTNLQTHKNRKRI